MSDLCKKSKQLKEKEAIKKAYIFGGKTEKRVAIIIILGAIFSAIITFFFIGRI